MSVYSIYFSPTGGTKTVADILTKEFSNCIDIDLCTPVQNTKTIFSENDLCCIAVPSFGGRVPATAAGRLKTLTGNHTSAVLIVVYGNRAYEDTLLELSDIVSECGFTPIAAVTAIAEHSIMHQFAAGRPDIDDIRMLTSFAERIVKKAHTAASYEKAATRRLPVFSFPAAALTKNTAHSLLCLLSTIIVQAVKNALHSVLQAPSVPTIRMKPTPHSASAVCAASASAHKTHVT